MLMFCLAQLSQDIFNQMIDQLLKRLMIVIKVGVPILNFVWTNCVLITVVVTFTVSLSEKWVKFMHCFIFICIEYLCKLCKEYLISVTSYFFVLFLDKIWKLLTYHMPS